MLLATLLLAAGLSGCGGGGGGGIPGVGGGGGGGATTGTFRFTNNSGNTIYYLYLWPASQGTSQQGPDQLGASVLANGASYDVVNVPCGTNMYFRATTSPAGDGSYYYWTDVGGSGPKSVSCGGTFTWTLGAGTYSPPTTPPPPTTGTLSVYLSNDTGGGPVTLKVDGGTVYTFTQIAPTGYTPPCGAASNGYLYTATVSAGSHSVSASNSNATWPGGTVNVPAGGCYRIQLNATSPPPTTGTLTVYLSNDTGGGPVTLRVDGSAVYTFTQYVTSAPSCGVASYGPVYTATVSAGSHSISASNSNTTWPGGTVSVPAGGCYLLGLN